MADYVITDGSELPAAIGTSYQTLYQRVLRRGHLSVTDAVALPKVKEWINVRYQQIARLRPWKWLLKQGVIDLLAPYTTGTVTTDGTATVTGDSTVWTASMVGRRFKSDDFDEVYLISAVGGATSLTLNTTFKGDDGSAKTYSILEPKYDLAADFDRFIDPHRSFTPYKLEPLGIGEMNRRWGLYGQSGVPTHYSILPDSGSTLMNLILYPAPDLARTLYYDYLRTLTLLSGDDDEPLIPENYRDILEIGAYADLLNYKDDQRSAFWEAQFERRLADLAADYAITDDFPKMRPADHYRSYYRSPGRGRVDDPVGFDRGLDRR